MNRLIIFDLDGVLIDSKELHYEALNKALSFYGHNFVITKNEQKNIYEGLPTKTKLKLLTKNKGLPISLHEEISKLKQDFTNQMLDDIQKDEDLIKIMQLISSKNIDIAVASNSISSTIDKCLQKLGIVEYIKCVISNEDVSHPKPHPEMYWKAMSFFGRVSDETVIFEDSLVGKMAAVDSKAHLIEVKNRSDLTLEKVKSAIKILESVKSNWKDFGLNVVIPMSGAGSRFSEMGYSFPKPLIDVNGKPMIQAVVDSLGIKSTYTYIVQKDHYDKYNLEYLLNAITPNCNIVQIEGITEGAAVSVLKAKNIINNESPLIIANSDQIVDWNSRDFIYSLTSKNMDGGIATFTSTHPRWSYARIGDSGLVVEVAEKKPISDTATVGIYYWRHGSDFVKYAEQMIENNIRVNNEFYVCPVYNEAIQDGKRVSAVPVQNMWGVGIPEDLQYYLSLNKR